MLWFNHLTRVSVQLHHVTLLQLLIGKINETKNHLQNRLFWNGTLCTRLYFYSMTKSCISLLFRIKFILSYANIANVGKIDGCFCCGCVRFFLSSFPLFLFRFFFNISFRFKNHATLNPTTADESWISPSSC